MCTQTAGTVSIVAYNKNAIMVKQQVLKCEFTFSSVQLCVTSHRRSRLAIRNRKIIKCVIMNLLAPYTNITYMAACGRTLQQNPYLPADVDCVYTQLDSHIALLLWNPYNA